MAGFGGWAQGYNNYLDQQARLTQADDQHQLAQLQKQRAIKALQEQDAATLAQLKIDSEVANAQALTFDDNGNLIPNGGIQPVPSPIPPMPGQASTPAPPPQIPQQMPQGGMPPPMQGMGQGMSQQMRPPMPPQGNQAPPQMPFMQAPMQTPGQPPMQSSMQQMRPPVQAPQQAIPPYVNLSSMQAHQQQQAPEQAPMAPPSLSPMQIPGAQETVAQAKQMTMPDEQFKEIFKPQLTKTEKELGAYKKAYPNMSNAAIMRLMGFDSSKDLRDQINKEQDRIEKQQEKQALLYDRSLSRESTDARAKASLASKSQSSLDNVSDDRKKEIEFYAKKSLAGDDSWKTGMSRGKDGQALIAQVNARVASMAEEQGVSAGDTNARKATIKAATGALAQNTKDLAAIRPYKDMLDKNADIAIELAKKISRSDSSLANRSLNWINSNMGDNPDVKEFLAQTAIIQTEASRVLNNPRLVGQLTDSARQEMQHIFDGSTPLQSYERILNRMKQDGSNRVDAMVKESESLKKDIAGGGVTDKSGSSGDVANGGKPVTEDMYNKLPKGTRYMAPNGQMYTKN